MPDASRLHIGYRGEEAGRSADSIAQREPVGEMKLPNHREWFFRRCAGHDDASPERPERAASLQKRGDIREAGFAGEGGNGRRRGAPHSHRAPRSALDHCCWRIAPSTTPPTADRARESVEARESRLRLAVV